MKNRFLRLLLVSVLSVSAFQFLSVSSAFATDPVTITAASVAPSTSNSAKFGQCTAGATITQGQLLYQDSSTNTCKLADADASAAAAKVIGISLQSVGSGQSVRYCYYDPSFTTGDTHAIGDTFWSSTTAGGMTTTFASGVATGNYVTFIGVGISTTKIFLNITRSGVVRP